MHEKTCVTQNTLEYHNKNKYYSFVPPVRFYSKRDLIFLPRILRRKFVARGTPKQLHKECCNISGKLASLT